MCFITFPLLLILLPFSVTLGQNHPYDPARYMEWNEFYALTWENFKAVPADDTFGDAGTVVKIIAKPYKRGNRIDYNVYALFDRTKSWTFEEDPSLLAHEQLHFDLAELAARKIRKKVEELSAQNVKRIKDYNSAINRLLKENSHLDEQYDRETFHGALRDKQELWKQKITSELDALEKYKKERKVIGGK